MLALWLSLTTALAGPCDTAMTVDELRGLADRANAALDMDDMVTHARAFTDLRERAECIREPVSAEEWARMLVSLALVEHALGRNWRAPLTAALLAFPGVDHQVGPDDIRNFPLPTPDPTHYIPVADDGIFFLDGRQVTSVPPGDLEGPHLVQSYAEGTWETRYLSDAPYPGNWLAPVSSTETTTRVGKRSPVPLVAGLGLAVAGTGAGLGSWAVAQGKGADTPAGTISTLKATNIAGWTLAGVGAGLVSWHLIGGTRVSAGPNHIQLQGAF